MGYAKTAMLMAAMTALFMFFHKALNFFEARDNTLFTWRPGLRFLLFNFDAKLGKKRIVVLGEFLNHWQPPPS